MKFVIVLRSVFAVCLIALSLLMAIPAEASAHPLGNFTVNRYAGIETTATSVRIVYVLDEAEIPTFQDQPAVDADRAGFIRQRADLIRSGISLQIDGKPVDLVERQTLLTQPDGQGGLKTLRLSIVYEAPLAGTSNATHSLSFKDNNEPDRVGWREIVAQPTGDSTIGSSSVSATDTSNELRTYPESLIQAPLDVRSADVTFNPGTQTPPLPVLSDDDASATGRATDRFGDLAGNTALTAGGIAAALGLALIFGAGHALGPGHGKSVMAAYLVGTRGRPIDAVWLGIIVALMHTGSVLVLGLGLLLIDSTADLSRLYPILTLVSGLVVLSFGLVLGWSRLKTLRHDRLHAKEHAHAHRHGHDHDHGHEHADEKAVQPLGVHSHGGFSHSHAIPDGVAPLSRKGLILLAGSGGLLPSPSAIIVIISSASLNRLPLGLALVAVFSVGLAATLSAVGLSLVYGRNFMLRRPGAAKTFRLLPVLSAAALVVLGIVIAIRGISGL